MVTLPVLFVLAVYILSVVAPPPTSVVSTQNMSFKWVSQIPVLVTSIRL